MKQCVALFAWAVVCFLATTLPGATKTLVDDRFEDASTSKLTALEADWVSVGPGGTLETKSEEKKPGTLPDKVLIFRPGKSGGVIVGTFDMRNGDPAGGGSGISLGARPGDQLVLACDFRCTVPPGPDTRIGIGLFNNAGTPGEKGHPATQADDLGYRATLTAWGGHGVIQKVAGQGGAIGDTGYPVALGAMLGKPTPPLGNGWHAFKLILRREAQAVTVTASVDGTMFNTGIDSSASDAFDDPPGLIATFHEIIVSLAGGIAAGLALDNVRLHSYSEPATWQVSWAGVLKAAGLLGVMGIILGIIAAVCYKSSRRWRT